MTSLYGKVDEGVDTLNLERPKTMRILIKQWKLKTKSNNRGKQQAFKSMVTSSHPSD